MTHVVTIQRLYEARHWLAMTRWLESMVGPIHEMWYYDSPRGGSETYFEFSHAGHARKFEKIWGPAPIIFPYDFWSLFWTSDIGRRRMNNKWMRKAWRPVAVLVDTFEINERTFHPTLQKGRRCHSPGIGWFFEKEADAEMFWFEWRCEHGQH